MNDNNVPKFNIPIDEENPDAQFQEDIDERQTAKLNKRITRTSLLIIALMGVVILFAYVDFKKKLSKMSTSGNTEIQTLSKGMQSKLSSLLLQQEKIEELLAEKITPLEKTVAAMQTNLKEISTAITQIRSAGHSANKKTAGAIEAINKTLAPMPKKLEQLASEIDQFKEKYANELAGLARMTTNIQGQIQTLQSDVETLSSSQLNKKKLAIELLNERSIYQEKLAQFQGDMESRLVSIEKRLKEMEKTNASLKENITARPRGTHPSQPQRSDPVDEPIQPPSGSIIEQDIQYHGQGNTTSNSE